MSETLQAAAPSAATGRPRLGFLGVGWIGRHRMEAIAATGAAQIVAIADPSAEMASEAAALAPGAEVVGGLETSSPPGSTGW